MQVNMKIKNSDFFLASKLFHLQDLKSDISLSIKFNVDHIRGEFDYGKVCY